MSLLEVARVCTRCGVAYPPDLCEAAFRSVRTRDASCVRKPGNICRRCEQTARDAKKHANRFRVKARDVLRRHAKRLTESNDGWAAGRTVTQGDLIAMGWDVDQIAHEIEFHYGNGCAYCWHPFAEMGHGLSDITLDIVDRSKPPHYRTNTKWVCQTCNRKKGVMTPEGFELDLRMNHWHDQQIVAMRAAPQEFGRLFFLEAC